MVEVLHWRKHKSWDNNFNLKLFTWVIHLIDAMMSVSVVGSRHGRRRQWRRLWWKGREWAVELRRGRTERRNTYTRFIKDESRSEVCLLTNEWVRIGIAISTNLLSLLLLPLLQMLFMKFDEYHSLALQRRRWQAQRLPSLPHIASTPPPPTGSTSSSSSTTDDDHSSVHQPVCCCLEKIFSVEVVDGREGGGRGSAWMQWMMLLRRRWNW